MNSARLAILAGGAFFALASSAAASDREAPIITHSGVTRAPLGQPVLLRAKINDLSDVFAPSISVRPKGSQEYVSIEMRAVPDGFEGTIPAEQVTSDLEYFIEAFDEHGNGPGRRGSPTKPLLLTVYDPAAAPTPPPPAAVAPVAFPPDDTNDDDGIGAQWWFWTIVGVAVAGGATGVFVALRPPGTVDFVDIRVRGPDPTRGL